ncbi:hypothetical protein L2E82_19674 [Cichorium intybus]|uniref:Uncharacterized protein n=1 Tax=Cichorium intybus TaxID=13427 RepID=A0ACB9FD37_CICIN|nr:hypothetical protein L2E82_19674 [Cichorium intybus]
MKTPEKPVATLYEPQLACRLSLSLWGMVDPAKPASSTWKAKLNTEGSKEISYGIGYEKMLEMEIEIEMSS